MAFIRVKYKVARKAKSFQKSNIQQSLNRLCRYLGHFIKHHSFLRVHPCRQIKLLLMILADQFFFVINELTAILPHGLLYIYFIILDERGCEI